jgi:hypothetical protein
VIRYILRTKNNNSRFTYQTEHVLFLKNNKGAFAPLFLQ